MKLLLIFTTSIFLQAQAKVNGQNITLQFKNASLEKVFAEIEKQSLYHFIYAKEELEKCKAVTIDIKNASLTEALDECLKKQTVTYVIKEQYIIIKEKQQNNLPGIIQNKIITGKVLNEKGEGIGGATVAIKGSNIAAACDENGEFKIEYAGNYTTLVVSSIGYATKEIVIDGQNVFRIVLQISINPLDETIVIAYGSTTKRLNTGSVGKISAKELEKQPVSNLLAALHGKIPGLNITEVSGIPGAAVKVEIRGRTSINSVINNDPLFIIDGVPLASNNDKISQSASAFSSTGLSPFSSINPADVESIEVLKDADATAIYGSRGANGVILITTKKGTAGKTKATLNFYSGISKVTRTMKMLNTVEYLKMRREAFENDGFIPNASPGSTGYAPDLMIWDTTRYTDFRKLLIGGTARMINSQLTLSGGNSTTQFLFASGYEHETTVYPGDLSDNRVSFHTSITHCSMNKKFNLSFKSSYVYDKNTINVSDLSSYLRLPPNLPSLYDSLGHLNWQNGGVTFDNPLANSLRKYTGETNNLLSNLQISYDLLRGINLKTNIGYNTIDVTDINLTPIASQNPALNPLGSSSFGSTHFRSIIIEPQIHYNRNIRNVKISSLVGLTYQQNDNSGSLIRASGFNNDALIKSVSAAASTIISSHKSLYRYAASYGRINLNWDDRYLLNLTGRRDGSSRFGPGKQFANFGAIGTAWIFSEEKIFKLFKPFLYYGKLRMSFGTTGNDKIGDYGYLDTYSSTGLSYQGSPGIYPTTLFNPDFAWELNKKIEASMDLGFLRNQLLFSITYYRNRCSNQLINYSLPSQTGGMSIVANFPATVQNNGLEAELGFSINRHKDFELTSSINISIPQNKLVSFPGIESSSYSTLVIGEPLSIQGGYKFSGVNSQTGIFEFIKKDGQITSSPVSADKIKNLANLEPDFYGGFQNILRYRNCELEIFFEFKKQDGFTYFNYIYSASSTFPGTMNNQPAIVMNRWHEQGDKTDIQKFSTRSGTAAFNAANVIRISGTDKQFGDASYVRLKNISLTYSFPNVFLNKMKLSEASIFLRAQNILTLTNYKGSDPETQELFRLPPLRTFVVGFNLSL